MDSFTVEMWIQFESIKDMEILHNGNVNTTEEELIDGDWGLRFKDERFEFYVVSEGSYI